MKNHFYYLLQLFLIIFSTSLKAQNDIKISGKVINRDANKKIVCNDIVLDFDKHDHFNITLPTEKASEFISFGYQNSGDIVAIYVKKGDSLAVYWDEQNPTDFEITFRKIKPKTQLNQPAPDFALKDLEGKEIRLADLRGKVVFLDFRATLCRPCVTQLPKIQNLQEKFRDKDLVFVFISLDRDIAQLKDFLKYEDLRGIHILKEQNPESTISEDYEVIGVPTSFLIDKEGLLINFLGSNPSKEDLIKSIETALDKN